MRLNDTNTYLPLMVIPKTLFSNIPRPSLESNVKTNAFIMTWRMRLFRSAQKGIRSVDPDINFVEYTQFTLFVDASFRPANLLGHSTQRSTKGSELFQAKWEQCRLCRTQKMRKLPFTPRHKFSFFMNVCQRFAEYISCMTKWGQEQHLKNHKLV